MARATPALPQGFAYEAEAIQPAEEQDLVRQLAALPLAPFEFHGYLGKRRVVSFGWRYDYESRSLGAGAALPDFLLPFRERAAAFAGLDPAELQQVLVTEYAPGAGIGWHRDKPMFDDVVALSLGAACRLRFRHRSGTLWERVAQAVEPRSLYLLRGAARLHWEHSIPPLAALRYSVTFRSLAAKERWTATE